LINSNYTCKCISPVTYNTTHVLRKTTLSTPNQDYQIFMQATNTNPYAISRQTYQQISTTAINHSAASLNTKHKSYNNNDGKNRQYDNDDINIMTIAREGRIYCSATTHTRTPQQQTKNISTSAYRRNIFCIKNMIS